ncbi:MAG: hypothetical protein QM308_01725 [Bacillota bacterium]|nr:hypothetical protein [Bacillota bacterium]
MERLLNLEARVDSLEGVTEPVEDPPETTPEPTEETPTYKIVAGVIRGFPGGTWGVIKDSAHEPLNIKSVSVDGNRVIVNYSFTAKKVISLIAAPDEYYTQMGVSCGASVGKAAAAVYFNKRPNTGYADPMSLRSGNANVWIYGIFEVDE